MPLSPEGPISLTIPHISGILPSDTGNSVTSSTQQRSAARRPRSGSLVEVQEVPINEEDILDQSAYRNVNPEWVNAKGAWLIHPFLIISGKLMIDSIPGMTQPMSWTIVNLAYMMLSYLMFHYVTGTPFGSQDHSGAYDDLTMWEQIDEGAQYTPAKKWLACVPIALFLISTHYTRYDPWAFAINFTALIIVLVAKLPQMHRQRLRFLPPHTPAASNPMTPISSKPSFLLSDSLPNSGRTTPVQSSPSA